MKPLVERLRRLEDQFGLAEGKPQILLVLCKAGWGLALDSDTCIDILGESRLLPTGRVGLVNMLKIPDGLNAAETERYLRDNAAEICGRRMESEAA